MNNKIVLMLVAISVISIFFISDAITGLVVIDETVKEACHIEDDCGVGRVCCPFFAEENGVCHVEDVCPKILEITQVQKEKKLELLSLLGEYPPPIVIKVESEREMDPASQFMLGATLFLMTFLVLVLYIRYHHIHDPKPKRRRSRA